MITGAQKDLDFTQQKIAEFKKAESQIAFLQKQAETQRMRLTS